MNEANDGRESPEESPDNDESEEEQLPSGPEQGEGDRTFVEIPLQKYQDLQEQAQERDEYLQQLRKVTADYDNYQKRMRRKRDEEKKFAARDVVKSVLPVLDDFDQALPDEDGEQDELVTGMRMIYDKLVDVIEEQGAEQIDETGVAFDPNCHEAVTYVEDEQADGQEVAEVLRKGYRMHDQVLRPARVVIAKPPQSGEGA